MRLVISRLKYSILKVKWLKELEEEEWTNKMFKFQERNIKECYKVITRKYFIKNKPKILKEVY